MDKRMVDQEFHNEDTDLELSLRPTQLKQYIGQSSIKSNLEVFIKAAKLRQEPLDHVLLFGPPGLGKTTLSNIIANEMEVNIRTISGPSLERPGDLAAILSGLQPGDVLFIDEIHRFNKSQQDSLLHAVEKGWIVLIGATTENPSFEVVSALLSRSQVYILKALTFEKLEELADISVSKYNEINNTKFYLEEK